jgi:hypothetical protein
MPIHEAWIAAQVEHDSARHGQLLERSVEIGVVDAIEIDVPEARLQRRDLFRPLLAQTLRTRVRVNVIVRVEASPLRMVSVVCVPASPNPI